MTIPAIATPQLGSRWHQDRLGPNDLAVSCASPPGTHLRFSVRRSVTGRLRHTYPAGLHDLELFIADSAAGEGLATALHELCAALFISDSRCRRVVLAAPAGNRAVAEAAEAAGYRHAVDVDTTIEELSLFVAEPASVKAADTESGWVQGT
jgi:hypothetical protein